MIEQRPADLTDTGFISSCILYGARKGCYTVDAENKRVVSSMKAEIRSVIVDQRLADDRCAQATIYLLEGKRIAVTILSEASPGDSCYEIYAMSVQSSYQNKGYGGLILDSILQRLHRLDICARCQPGATRMLHLLQQSGFVFHSKDNDFIVMLRTAIVDYSMAEPLYLRC